MSNFVNPWHLLALLTAVLTLAACEEQPAERSEVVWHLSTWGSPRAVTTAIDFVADYVERQSGGEFKIKVHYGESVSPARQNLESLSIGLVDAAQTCSSYHPGKTPAMTALELPFLPIDGLDATIRIHTVFYRLPTVERELAAWNAQLLFLVPTPQPEFMGRGAAPRDLDDWKGMRVRATGGLAQAMIELKAAPVSAPPPEVYLGLERNLFQAAAFPFTYAFGAYRLFEVSDWYTTNMRAAGFNCPVLANRDSYAALPDRFKALLNEAIPLAYQAQEGAFIDADKRWLDIFHSEGLEPITYDAERIQSFRSIAAQPVWEKWHDFVSRYGVDGETLLAGLERAAEPNPPLQPSRERTGEP